MTNATATAIAPTLAPPAFSTMFAKKATSGLPKSITIMGEPGTRKTTIAGGILNVPNFAGKRMVYLDVDNGTESWASFPEIWQHFDEDFAPEGKTSVNVIHVDKTSPDAWSQIQYFLGHINDQGTFIKGALFDAGYDIVGVDALDVIQDIAGTWYLHNTFNEKGKIDTRGAYGPIGQWTTGLAWALQNSKELGITVMHTSANTDEGGVFKIRPKLVGASKDSYGGVPSVVVYVELRKDKETNKKHTIGTIDGDGTIAAKNRFKLDDEIFDFDLIKLYGTLAERPANQTAAPAAE